MRAVWTYVTYDHWKTTNTANELLGPEPPPCEVNYAGRIHQHPRFPSGDCTVCGALCTEACKHELAVGDWALDEGHAP